MTLKDVAKLSNCSVATVSKALKNSPEISEEAKQRIVSVAKKSGYLKKATTHKAVLGGLKTVIYNDINGDGVELLPSLQSLAKKFGMILTYVSLSVKEAKELMNQLGSCGLVIKGALNQTQNQRVMHISDDISEVTSFFKWISEYKPKRPSRAGASNKKSPSKKDEEYVVEALIPPEPAETETEEIWLL